MVSTEDKKRQLAECAGQGGDRSLRRWVDHEGEAVEFAVRVHQMQKALCLPFASRQHARPRGRLEAKARM